MDARECAVEWRYDLKIENYSVSILTSKALLPDSALKKITSNTRLQTIEDIEGVLEPPWVFARKHGADLLAELQNLDQARIEKNERKKASNRESRKQATAQRRAKEKEERDHHRAVEEMRKQSTGPNWGPSRDSPMRTPMRMSLVQNQVVQTLQFTSPAIPSPFGSYQAVQPCMCFVPEQLLRRTNSNLQHTSMLLCALRWQLTVQ